MLIHNLSSSSVGAVSHSDPEVHGSSGAPLQQIYIVGCIFRLAHTLESKQKVLQKSLGCVQVNIVTHAKVLGGVPLEPKFCKRRQHPHGSIFQTQSQL